MYPAQATLKHMIKAWWSDRKRENTASFVSREWTQQLEHKHEASS